MTLEVVTLRNGAQEAKPLVAIIWAGIRKLLDDPMGGGIVMYELVMKCRDSNHQFFGNTGDRLKALRLVELNGAVHNSIRNIVLSSAEGEGLQMSFRCPVADEELNDEKS